MNENDLMILGMYTTFGNFIESFDAFYSSANLIKVIGV